MSSPTASSIRTFLRELLAEAIAAASPTGRLAPLPSRRVRGRTILLGAGKAAAAMAAEFERVWGEPVEGLVVTRYGHAEPTRSIEVIEAAHPVPDAQSVAAAARMMELARAAGKDDQVVFLGSGGASSLLVLPAAGISLAQKQAVNERLLASGAPIEKINVVRKAMSAIKGGRLAAACAPAPVTNLLISDVASDDPAAIGSGPAVPDTQLGELDQVLAELALELEPEVEAAMRANRPAILAQKPAVHMPLTATAMLAEVAQLADEAGWRVMTLGAHVVGEAREVASSMARDAKALQREATAPTLMLSGGETTVTVAGSGSGGRNQEFLLALALALDGCGGIYALAADTDGLDGNTSAAGGIVDPASLARMRANGLEPAKLLEQNGANAALAASGDLVTTGPTRTNVNDFRAVAILPVAERP